MKKEHSVKKLLDISFTASLLVKGLIAGGEIIIGIAVFFLPPERMTALISWISAGELSEDPTDWLMNQLVLFGQSFSVGTQHFAIIYFLSHGIVNLIVVLLLWKKLYEAYPISIVALCGFIVYQMVEFFIGYSILMLLLTALDLFIIVMTVQEYKDMQARENKTPWLSSLFDRLRLH